MFSSGHVDGRGGRWEQFSVHLMGRVHGALKLEGEEAAMGNELHEAVIAAVMAESRAWCWDGGGAAKEGIQQDLKARVLDVSSA